ncbi:MAG: 2-C-methyl-D-erythritol 4-phosphate cytidylyltransferase [Alcanivoracaceae bacterium]|nr:2-C-methyl-D-erythritol 4-phosphate cytidylyltransferase [Alcanivoracaceae bacterium]
MALPADARLFAVVPAAGTGSRMGAALPKQYLTVQGRTIAEHTLGRLLSFARIEKVVVATSRDDMWWPQLQVAHHNKVISSLGGRTRAESVLASLESLRDIAADTDWVLVHDMARPCVRLSDVENLIQQCEQQGAILARPVTDTIKQADNSKISATLQRDNIWCALTPQLFPIGALRDALIAGIEKGLPITDEASAMEAMGWKPKLVSGRVDNIKVTLSSDLQLARFYLAQQDDEGLEWESA